MRRSRVRASCAVLALLVSTAPSHAETVVETAVRWNLIGTWRASCSAPAYFFDPQETYVVRGPNRFFEQDTGSGKQTFPVTSAVIQNDGKIELMIVDTNLRTRRKNVLERNPEGRIRLLTSSDADTGGVYVRDARMANGLRRFDWQQRCS
jgi:hypothetical protein